MPKKIVIIISCLIVAGCSDSSPPFVAGADADADSDSDTDLPDVAVSDETLPAADPKLPGFESWPIVFSVDPKAHTGLECRIEIAREETVIASIDGELADDVCTAAWNGRDGEGGWVAPGQVDATAIVSAGGGDPLAQGEAVLEVVRLGLGEIQMAGDRRRGGGVLRGPGRRRAVAPGRGRQRGSGGGGSRSRRRHAARPAGAVDRPQEPAPR